MHLRKSASPTPPEKIMSSCWTCLAWKKRCSDTAIPCETCASLKLPCYGYGGTPPDWRDGGPKERAQAKYFKTIVKETLAGRGKRRMPNRKNSMRSSLVIKSRSNSDTKISTTRSTSPFDSTMCLPVTTFAETYPHQPQVFDISPEDMNIDPSRLSEDLPNLPHDPAFDSYFVAPPFSDSTPYCSSGLLDHAWITPAASIGKDHTTAPMMMQHQPVLDTPPASRRGSEQIQTLSLKTLSLLPSLNLSPDDCKTLAFFLEFVLPSTFPLVEEENLDRIREAILSAVAGSRTCLSLILSQSVLYQQSRLETFGLSKRDYRNISADLEQQALSGVHDLLKRLETPNTLTHGPHMDLALQAIIACLTLMNVLRGSKTPQQLSSPFSDIPFIAGMDSAHQPDSKFFTGFIAIVDLLSSSISGHEPAFALKHQDIFSAEQTHLPMQLNVSQICGVETGVMQAILQTSLLSGWKAKQIATNSLSVTELVKRATAIEDLIVRQRNEVQNLLLNEVGPSPSAKNTWILSNIFASATLVYLRTLVSGPNPDVTDIRSAVKDTMEAIQLVPDPTLLARLSWPICIAASMASKNDRIFWKRISDGLKLGGTRFGAPNGLTKVLDLVERCWTLRDEDGTRGIIDWSEAMKSSDESLVIF